MSKYFAVKTDNFTPENLKFLRRLAVSKGLIISYAWGRYEPDGIAININDKVLYICADNKKRFDNLSYESLSLSDFTQKLISGYES